MPSAVTLPFIQCHHVRGRADAAAFLQASGSTHRFLLDGRAFHRRRAQKSVRHHQDFELLHPRRAGVHDDGLALRLFTDNRLLAPAVASNSYWERMPADARELTRRLFALALTGRVTQQEYEKLAQRQRSAGM